MNEAELFDLNDLDEHAVIGSLGVEVHGRWRPCRVDVAKGGLISSIKVATAGPNKLVEWKTVPWSTDIARVVAATLNRQQKEFEESLEEPEPRVVEEMPAPRRSLNLAAAPNGVAE